MNAGWHKNNVMPRNATMDQRIKWHIAHARFCACRAMPKTVQAAIDKKHPKSR